MVSALCKSGLKSRDFRDFLFCLVVDLLSLFVLFEYKSVRLYVSQKDDQQFAGSLFGCNIQDNHLFKFCLNFSNIIFLWLSVWALSYFCWKSSRITDVLLFQSSYCLVCSGVLNPLFFDGYHLFLFFNAFIYAFWIGDWLSLYFFVLQPVDKSCLYLGVYYYNILQVYSDWI